MPIGKPTNFFGTELKDRVKYDTVVLEALENIINYGRGAEGSTLPPSQAGDFRIPFPNGIRVLNSFSTDGDIVIGWIDPEYQEIPIGSYNVYVSGAILNNQQPTLLGQSRQSPCHVKLSVLPEAGTVLTFFLQPVLVNGLALPINVCPSVTLTVPE